MSVRQLPPPRPSKLAQQLRFLIRIVELVPQLIAALEAGHVEAGQKLGRRRLKDGRTADLWLVARTPKRDEGPSVTGKD